MSKQAKKWIDNLGREVPAAYVKPFDKIRDREVRAIVAEFTKVRGILEKTMAGALARVDKIKAAYDAEPGAVKRGLGKGNYQVQSFNGLLRVSIDQQYRIQLDERVKEARDRMLAYAKGLCAKAGADAQALYEIVEEAFAASKSGGLSVARVLSLCRRNINAPEWVAARAMLLESIKPEKSKAYISVETRPDTQHDWRPIRLDIADCWPSEPVTEGGAE